MVTFCIFYLSLSFAQIPNNDFELWEPDTIYEKPVGWTTNNGEFGGTGVTQDTNAYSGNYARAHESEQLDQDRGIVTFQLLDEFRRAMRADPGFEPVFNLQWERAQSYCCGIASRDQYNPKAVIRAEEQKEKVRALRKELREARADLASLPAALRGWWKERRRQRPSGADRADD